MLNTLPPIWYTGGALNRVSDWRIDKARIEALRSGPEVRVVPVWRARSLVVPGDPPEAVVLQGEAARAVLDAAAHTALLGIDGETPYFAADLSDLDEDAVAAHHNGGVFDDLRPYGALLAREVASMAIFARGILHWHRTQRFCGACGAPTTSESGGHMLKCSDAACGRMHFPRLDPAVIMLVIRDTPKGPYALLSRKKEWPEGMNSTLAGFVEIGESLEEAVIREVFEETGVHVTDPVYMGSQPWPFPSSLMLGYRAKAISEEITVDHNELVYAQWYSRDEVVNIEEQRKRLPRADSIARWLVEGWLRETA